MGTCWFCHWGWPKALSDIYKRAVADIEALPYKHRSGAPGLCQYRDGDDVLQFGPTHCLWSDENFGGSLEFELKECDNYDYSQEEAMTPQEIAIVRRSVLEVLALPDDVRNPVPADYDNENPKNYPPPAHIPWTPKRECRA